VIPRWRLDYGHQGVITALDTASEAFPILTQRGRRLLGLRPRRFSQCRVWLHTPSAELEVRRYFGGFHAQNALAAAALVLFSLTAIAPTARAAAMAAAVACRSLE
jgi:hypothetical protein